MAARRREILRQRRTVLVVGALFVVGTVVLASDTMAVRLVGSGLVSAGLIAALVWVVRWRGGVDEKISRLVATTSAQESGLEAVTSATALVDRVLGTHARRPWDPALLPPSRPGPGRVLLLVGADYHLPELVAVRGALADRGIEAVLAAGPSQWDRVAGGAAWYGAPVEAVTDPRGSLEGVRALLTMKDWAGYGDFVAAAHEVGIPTIAKVEGVSDFSGGDGFERYRSAGLVLCLGDYDRERLEGRPTSLVGSTRLERLWLTPVAPRPPGPVLINLNFAYGAHAEHRSAWLRSVVAACRQADVPFVVSIHPAETATVEGLPVSSLPLSSLLPVSSRVVSRFSNVVVEAIARGVEPVYHNPHGEQEGPFAEPMGAFAVSRSSEELADRLAGPLPEPDEVRANGAEFFGYVVDVDPTTRSEVRAAEAIARVVAG